MTEQAPSGLSTLEKERARLARDREKFEQNQKRKEDILNGAESFGMYDEDVTPAEGELTFEEYAAQRPAEGIVRNGDNFQDAQSGKFATQEAYEAQKGDIQDHYDQLGGLVNTGEYQIPNYEDMGVVQLAKEASKARALGDRAGEEEIRVAVEHHLTMDAMKDDSETPEEAQARFEAEVARYDSLVERFENLSATAKPEQVTSQVVAEAASTEGVDEADGVNVEASAEPAATDFFVNTEGEVVLAGESQTTPEDDPVKGKELVVFEGEDSSETSDAIETSEAPDSSETSEETEEKEVSRFDRVKNWFKKERQSHQEHGGAIYWANKWERAQRGFDDKVLNHGVTSEMSDEEVEHKRKRNRVALIAGASVLAVAAVAGIGLYAYNDMVSADQIPSFDGGASAQEVVPTDVVSAPEVVAPSVDVAPVAPEVSIPAEAFNVSSGAGGEQLFTNLGIEQSKWYTNENTLLSQFPTEFYRMSDGHVGIAGPGMLSQGAQDFIKTLK